MTMMAFTVTMLIAHAHLRMSGDGSFALAQQPAHALRMIQDEVGVLNASGLHAAKQAVDVVIVAAKADCVLEAAVKGVRRYIQTAEFYFVMPEHECAVLPLIDAYKGIHCLSEDSIIPGITFQEVNVMFQEMYSGKTQTPFGYGAHTLTGWYLQQFLKLGFAAHYPKKSEYTLVWDADMIPIRPMHFFFRHG